MDKCSDHWKSQVAIQYKLCSCQEVPLQSIQSMLKINRWFPVRSYCLSGVVLKWQVLFKQENAYRRAEIEFLLAKSCLPDSLPDHSRKARSQKKQHRPQFHKNKTHQRHVPFWSFNKCVTSYFLSSLCPSFTSCFTTFWLLESLLDFKSILWCNKHELLQISIMAWPTKRNGRTCCTIYHKDQ